jgi:Ca2+-binding RTX toxin-like protein
MAQFPSNIDLSSLDGTTGFKLSGAAQIDYSGSVASAGDVNGDGFADLIVGAYRADPHGSNSGASYVVFGKASGFGANIDLSSLDGTTGFKLSGAVSGDYAGRSVASAGDVNGDGFADLIVGAGGADPHGSNSGASYVVFGKASGFAANIDLSTLDGTTGFKLSGAAVRDYSGFSVASAGDVNGDGFADLIVGAFLADPHGTDSGASYVVFGKASGFAANIDLSTLDGTAGFKLSGAAAGDFSGGSVASAGDVNGDGFADLIVGAYRADPHGAYSGASYVVFGKASGFLPNIDLSSLDGTTGFRLSGAAAYDFSGWSVASAGDVNGDGFADLIVGARGADPHGSLSGASYVLFGKASGFAANVDLSTLDGTTGFKLSGAAAGDWSGNSVASAGDVNGDGFADLIVGAFLADPHGTDSGASYVVFGRAGNHAPAGAVTITGIATEDEVLTADISTLTDADGVGTPHYQWQRSNGVGFDNVGLDQATYTLGDADVGATMRVAVSYTDGQGTVETITSAVTALVANVNDAPAGGVTIAGTATEDEVLTADTSTLTDADGLGTPHYQWQRSNGVGFDDVGLDQATYTLGDADVGTTLRVVVRYTDGRGTVETITSAATAAVANVNDAPAGAVTITGTAAEDQVLTADTSILTDADGLGTPHHQWQRSNGASFDDVGLDQATYSLGDADVGATLRVVVSYTDGHGTAESITSATTTAVANVNDAPVVTASSGRTVATEKIAVAVDPGLTLADVDSATLASATVAITGGFHAGEDVLAFANDGATMGNIAASYAAGTGILTLVSAGATATLAQWQAALRAVTYTDISDAPNAAERTVSFVINDGTDASTASTRTVSGVISVDDPAVAHNDAFTTAETTALGGSLFADNGAGADDPDGGAAFSVMAVNGNAAGMGGQITLLSGAHVTVNADGTFSYDPHHAFDYLAAPGSGASNTPATDQFTYTITGGTTATVTMTVTGVDSTDILQGTAGPDTLSAGIGTDTLNGQAGDDTLIGGPGADTLVGGPGSDTASYASSSLGVNVNLATGAATGGDAQGDTLAAIENLTGSAQPDVLTGDGGDNVLDGGGGADTMTGGTGNDTYVVENAGDMVIENAGEGTDTVNSTAHLRLAANVENLTLVGSADLQGYGNSDANTLTGNDGNNLLDGDVGADTMVGGAGSDVYFVDNGSDQVIENANEGNDAVFSTTHLRLAANVETLVLQGSADLQAYGNSLANMIIGNAGSNILDGDAGADAMSGGAGNDVYFVDNAGDMVIENADEGNDAVFSTAHFALTANAETLVLQGSADLQGYGNSLNNALFGNAGSNLLDGRGGVDVMVGGAGNDVYFVDDGGDQVIENPGEGTDAVFSGAHYQLSANVETLVLQGGADLQGYGNGLANRLYGNSGANLLDGGAGADIMRGGLGNDVYIVDNSGDLVFENASEGNDAVFASIDCTLTTNVETLVLQGSGNLSGTGNGGANTIVGNSGDNTLDGGAGADVLMGNAGNDTFVFHAGQANGDLVVDFASGVDSLQFVGYDASATFTQSDATHWQINYSGGTETIAFMNGSTPDLNDWHFV